MDNHLLEVNKLSVGDKLIVGDVEGKSYKEGDIYMVLALLRQAHDWRGRKTRHLTVKCMRTGRLRTLYATRFVNNNGKLKHYCIWR